MKISSPRQQDTMMGHNGSYLVIVHHVGAKILYNGPTSGAPTWDSESWKGNCRLPGASHSASPAAGRCSTCTPGGCQLTYAELPAE